MEQSVESNSFEKFKANSIVHCSYFAHQILFKKRFLKKSSKPGYENLVLITSTVQIELSKLNFFDDIRTNFLQVLTYYGFSRLLCYDDARQNQNRTKQSRTNIHLQLKFTRVLSCNYCQHRQRSNFSHKVVGNLIAEAEV